MVYKVFISHAFDQGDLYNSIVTRLSASNFDWIDSSVPRHRRYLANGHPLPDDQMKALLKPHLDGCDVFVVIAKPIVSRRPWLRWELEYAKASGKPVLAVWRRKIDIRVSKFALERADRCVDTWNIRSIIRAIEELQVAQSAKPARLPVDMSLIPDVSQLPVVEEVVMPLQVPADEPMAPVNEMALAPDEKIVDETPRDVLGPKMVPNLFPLIDAIPVADIVVLSSPAPPVDRPQEVLQAAINRRRWWQFWKPREGKSALRH